MNFLRQPTHTTNDSVVSLPLVASKDTATPIRNPHQGSDPGVQAPLISPLPPLARLESESEFDNDDGEAATAPFPGVDDGFFDKPPETDNPDVELLPKPQDPDETPTLRPRNGGGEPKDPDSDPDDVDAPGVPRPRTPTAPRPEWPTVYHYPPEKPGTFPYAPGFGPDVEGGVAGSLPDINVYQHRKTLAQGMMDLALLSANANQLRYVLESYKRHPYFYPSIAMVSISLILQVAVGVGLIWNARYNVKDEREICIANRINNFTIIGIFLITVINVFISAFGVADPPTTP